MVSILVHVNMYIYMCVGVQIMLSLNAFELTANDPYRVKNIMYADREINDHWKYFTDNANI